LNALTKLFVSLLIVCSLLLTGGVVVFVNKTDTFQKKVETAQAEKNLAVTERDTALRAAGAAQSQSQMAISQLNDQINKAKEAAQAAETEKAKLQADLNDAKKNLTIAMIQNTDASSENKAMVQNMGDLQKRLDAGAKENDTLRARNIEIVSSNTDLSKRLDAMERERRNLSEQLVQVKSDYDRALKIIKTADLNPTSPLVRPSEDIQGVVRKVQSKEGVYYATISLGSKDRVEKGMRFAIYNASTQKYLATLIVSAVENGESFGRLEGPAAADVVANNIVIPDPSPLANR
jgi:hypothetical protein